MTEHAGTGRGRTGGSVSEEQPCRLCGEGTIYLDAICGTCKDDDRLLTRVVGVLTEWGVLAHDGDFVDDEDFAEAIRDSGAWRLARDLREALGASA